MAQKNNIMKKVTKDYLIDMCQRGNTIRLYFGSMVENVIGDDWSDVPYESNAGQVYPEFVNCYIDVMIPFNWEVSDHAQEMDQYTNTKFCKNDFKSGDIPLFWCENKDNEHDTIYFHMGEIIKTVIEKLSVFNKSTIKVIKK